MQSKNNFDPFQEFFVIDTNNLENVNTKLYGYCIEDGVVLNNADGLKKIPCGEGTYVYVKSDDKKIHIYQDFIGGYGLYLYRNNDYFAISNSFIRLVDYIKQNYTISLNRDYANYLLLTGLCSFAYSETMVNEIQMLDRASTVEIDKLKKTFSVSLIDYKENTISINSEEGIAILDKWHSKWGSIIKSIAAQSGNVSVDLTGGFDSRVTLALFLSSGADMKKLCVNSTHNSLHTHGEDYEIASSIADTFGFALNDRTNFSKEHDNYSLADCVNISLYTKMCFHKEFYLRTFRSAEPRFSFSGNAGECVRGWSRCDYTEDEFIAEQLCYCKKYSQKISEELQNSIGRVLKRSLDGIRARNATLGKDSSRIVQDIYPNIRGRNHYPRGNVESYFTNTYILSPFYDVELSKLKLGDEACHDSRLVFAVIFDRYCPKLLDFRFDLGREINAGTVAHAREINKKFPWSDGGESDADFAEQPVCAVTHLEHRLPKLTPKKAENYLRELFSSVKLKNCFLYEFSSEFYSLAEKNCEKASYFPLRHAYSVIAISKVLRDLDISNAKSPSTAFSQMRSFFSSSDMVNSNLYELSNSSGSFIDNLVTARIDIKNSGESGERGCDIKILDIDDAGSEV